MEHRNHLKFAAVSSLVILLCVSVFMVVFFSIHSCKEHPGVAWKVTLEDFPELKEIHSKFVESCRIPIIPDEYFNDIASNATFQRMRADCMNINDEIQKKYEEFETLAKKEVPWASGVKSFYGVRYAIAETDHLIKNTEETFTEIPSEFKPCKRPKRVTEYTPRLGCYIRHITEELENFAVTKVKELMERLRLPNALQRLTDSRGATYMPPGGFMEVHSNRFHLAGWRLYLHYLPEKGESWFNYRHPFDKSFRKIADTTLKANLFRIRKLPEKLLWHSIYADTPRFSWGIWIPPELGQYLKLGSNRV
jgi:hypothetical protein